MYFSFKKLLDYQDNRYALAKACIEYAKKVRYLHPDDYHDAGDKDTLVAIDHFLEGKFNYTFDRSEIEIDLSEDSLLISGQQQNPGKDDETESLDQDDSDIDPSSL